MAEDLIHQNGTPEEQASFHSNDDSFAGAFLWNIPKDANSTMSTQEFRVALKLRLHIKFNTLLPRCCCTNHVPIDSHAIHLYTCNEFKHLMLMRHDAIQNDLKQLGLLGAISVIDSGLGHLLEEDGCKGDLLFKGQGRNGEDRMIDISIGSATAPSYLHSSAHTAQYVLKLLEDNKNTKYLARYRAVGIDFMPATFEMHGQASDTFLQFLKKLVRTAADVNGVHYSLMFNYWKIRLSTTLQKYNGKIMHMAQQKIARVNGCLVRYDDVDLVHDIITNERHVHNVA